MADDAFMNLFGKQAQAPSAPAPSGQAQAPAVQAQGDDAFNSLFKNAPQAQAPTAQAASGEPTGSSPTDAIPESPLSMMERGMMGWVRTPQEQEKLLRKHFDDVQMQQGPEGAGFVVKKDGKWFQADPAFEWKFSPGGATAGALLGAAGGIPGLALGTAAGGAVIPSLMDKKNRKDLAGDFAQMTGEYGLRSGAAMAGGEAGASAGAAVGAIGGPIGVGIGAAVGGLGGAALGAMGAESADLGSRALLLNKDEPGRLPYKDAKEVQQQLIASAMFGAQTYGLGKVTELGSKYVADKFAKVLGAFKATPEGLQSAKSLLQMLGAKAEHIDARLMNPEQNALFDKLAAQDALRGDPISKGALDKVYDATVDSIGDQVKGSIKRQGAEFARLSADPAVRNAEITTDNAFANALNELNTGKLVTEGGQLNQARELGANDGSAINFILRKAKQGIAPMKYDDARVMMQDLQTVINRGVDNPNLARILYGLKDDLHNSISQGLDGEASGLGKKYASIVSKYADAKALAEQLERATGDQKRFTIANKLSSANGNNVKDVMDSLVQAGIDKNELVKFLQIQGSKESQRWFGNARIAKYLPAPGPKLAATAINQASAARQALIQSGETLGSNIAETQAYQAALPYTNKIVSMMKGMPPEQLRAMLTNPGAVQAIQGMIPAATADEKGSTEALLQQLGVK